uniref:Uncharacterized protein n=1 Tax=viral metagenome TaxID=1070528 RepID=A0A6H1ZZD3_9ZZZZ
MGQGRRLPKRAELIESHAGIIDSPDSVNHGKRASVSRYRVPQSYADAGTEFVTMYVERGREHETPWRPDLDVCYQYSGKHVPDARRVAADCASLLRPTV